MIALECPADMLFPKLLDQFYFLLSDMLTLVGHEKAPLFFVPPPGTLERGQKLLKEWGYVTACYQLPNSSLILFSFSLYTGDS